MFSRLLWIFSFLLVSIGAAAAQTTDTLKVVDVPGALHITEHVKWADANYKIHGDLVLDKGGTLEIDNATVELMCEYSRQYVFKWQGGRLLSRNSTLGGTIKDGTIAHTNFDVLDGDFDCTNTTIRYCYGITFGNNETIGRMRATNLIAGVSPDTVIMTGHGDVVVRDSTYGFSLTAYAADGGHGDFDLPINEPLTRVFDGNNIPGAKFRLELINTRPTCWFLFTNVSNNGPPAEFILRRAPSLIPSVMGGDLEGTMTLPCNWRGGGPNWDNSGPIAPNTIFKTGNVTWKTLDQPVSIPCWGIYLYGDKTNLTITGPVVLAELMLWGGQLNLLGNPANPDIWATATTIEVGKQGAMTATAELQAAPPSRAELNMRNVLIGAYDDNSGMRGQITAHPGGIVQVENARCLNLTLINKPQGQITMKGIRKEGDFKKLEEGGPIVVEEVK